MGLSANQLLILRYRIKDTTAPYHFDDTVLSAFASEYGDDLDRTTVAMLEVRVAEAAPKTSYSIAGTSESAGEEARNWQVLLDHWRRVEGSRVFSGSAGVYRAELQDQDEATQ